MNWRDRSGLTLMELLVALVLVSVIAAGLASSTSFGIQVLDRTQRLEQTNTELALRFRVRHWLRTAASPALLADFDTGVIGNATSVRFITLAPTPFAPNSVALVINLTISDQKIGLEIAELNDEGNVVANHIRVLATQINAATISYFDGDPEILEWRDSWEDTNRLPLLIRISAESGSLPEWPEFTVRLAFAERG